MHSVSVECFNDKNVCECSHYRTLTITWMHHRNKHTCLCCACVVADVQEHLNAEAWAGVLVSPFSPVALVSPLGWLSVCTDDINICLAADAFKCKQMGPNSSILEFHLKPDVWSDFLETWHNNLWLQLSSCLYCKYCNVINDLDSLRPTHSICYLWLILDMLSSVFVYDKMSNQCETRRVQMPKGETS